MLYLRFNPSFASSQLLEELQRARNTLDQHQDAPDAYMGELRRHAIALSVHYSTRIEGNTLYLIKNADWAIDMDLGPGARGGDIVVEGTPERVAAHPYSRTAAFLRQALAKHGIAPEQAPAPRPRKRAKVGV